METYEELMEVLEMSEIFSREEAGEVVETMNLREYPPTIGNLLAYCWKSGDWTFTNEDIDILIEAYIQYISGKMGSTEEVEILRAELASARSACKDKDAKIKELEALNQK